MFERVQKRKSEPLLPERRHLEANARLGGGMRAGCGRFVGTLYIAHHFYLSTSSVWVGELRLLLECGLPGLQMRLNAAIGKRGELRGAMHRLRAIYGVSIATLLVGRADTSNEPVDKVTPGVSAIMRLPAISARQRHAQY